ncbi:hypothetical protein SAMN05444339_1107 [Loktanella atrilutea]|uniref:Uncharacterized protein n=1 Tax=Loktanella atrilutea TaxID=366533 RepID=A0A1M5DIT4_LOKAT|nr:hypothetical protein [Loktanella atrilutea]SHF66815.1 hypothetical protein SAMN05444339_1107 [Loktanella atrilutea]
MTLAAVQIALIIAADALFAGILILSPRPNIMGALLIVTPLYWIAATAATFALI